MCGLFSHSLQISGKEDLVLKLNLTQMLARWTQFFFESLTKETGQIRQRYYSADQGNVPENSAVGFREWPHCGSQGRSREHSRTTPHPPLPFCVLTNAHCTGADQDPNSRHMWPGWSSTCLLSLLGVDSVGRWIRQIYPPPGKNIMLTRNHKLSLLAAPWNIYLSCFSWWAFMGHLRIG